MDQSSLIPLICDDGSIESDPIDFAIDLCGPIDL